MRKSALKVPHFSNVILGTAIVLNRPTSCYVAQFTRNGFVFSRLKPYEGWETFEAEAKRLWCIYRELAEPSEVQRLGVRFIN